MATLYDRSGRPVEIPDAHVLKALSSGAYGLPKGPVDLMTPEGDHEAIDASQVTGSLAAGYTFESREHRAERLKPPPDHTAALGVGLVIAWALAVAAMRSAWSAPARGIGRRLAKTAQWLFALAQVGLAVAVRFVFSEPAGKQIEELVAILGVMIALACARAWLGWMTSPSNVDNTARVA